MDINQLLQKSGHLIEKSNYILIIPDQSLSGNSLEMTLDIFSSLKNSGKKADILVTAKNTSLLNYPLIKNIHDERAFVIKINTKEKPANQLKYEADKNQLKIIVDSEKENFSPKDVSFEYTPFKYDLIITIDFHDFENLGENFNYNKDFFTQTPVININPKSNIVFANKDFSW